VRFWNNDLVQNRDGVLDVIYAALYGSRDAEARPLKHERRQR
jgi:very-short-patch-repair endonuclease